MNKYQALGFLIFVVLTSIFIHEWFHIATSTGFTHMTFFDNGALVRVYADSFRWDHYQELIAWTLQIGYVLGGFWLLGYNLKRSCDV